MEKVLTLTTFAEEVRERPQLAYWLSRPLEERVAEVERLRCEYLYNFLRVPRDHALPGLSRSLRIVELNETDVAYPVVGAHAIAFHGAPRYTGDFGLLANPAEENVRLLLTALTGFGFPASELLPAYLVGHHKILQLGAQDTPLTWNMICTWGVMR